MKCHHVCVDLKRERAELRWKVQQLEALLAMKEADLSREICRLVWADSKADEELQHSMSKIDEGLIKIVGKQNFVPHERRYGRR